MEARGLWALAVACRDVSSRKRGLGWYEGRRRLVSLLFGNAIVAGQREYQLAAGETQVMLGFIAMHEGLRCRHEQPVTAARGCVLGGRWALLDTTLPVWFNSHGAIFFSSANGYDGSVSEIRKLNSQMHNV